MEFPRVGVLGGGQLGRMLVEAANRLNISVLVLDSGADGPAKQISSQPHLDGPFSSASHIQQLADQVDVLTVEIEHVDVTALRELQRTRKQLKIYPSPDLIGLIQTKAMQKDYLQKRGFPVPDLFLVQGKDLHQTVLEAIAKLGLPLMLKSSTMAYDGKGNFLLRSEDDIDRALEFLGKGSRPLFAEAYAPFVREIAVMVVRSADGITATYPAVETIHKENICHLVHAPLRSKRNGTARKAQDLARNAVDALNTLDGQGAVGVFGVEMFEMADGSLLINEIAPRPHNSGHYTIEACATSQYENHLRAILGLPLGDTSMKVGASSMLNILGASSSSDAIRSLVRTSLGVPGATVHMYGKAESRKGRKMGHITVVGSTDAEVRTRLEPLLAALPDPDKPTPATRKGHSHPHPLVSIIMGSDSDLPVMSAASAILEQLGIPHELEVVSAHRTPLLMTDFAQAALERGVRCIIAGAGGAAHLPGMVAALTSLPVIGVPVKGSTLDGVDSLHSIVQMPRGIPVATVAINNSANAALLAARILGTTDAGVSERMQAYMADMEAEVMRKREKMGETGWLEYKGLS